MINLLPDLEKQKLKKDYKLRVVFVCILSAVILLSLNIILLIPSYFISVYKAGFIPEGAKISDEEKAKFDELSKESQEANRLIKTLRPVEGVLYPSVATQLILGEKTAGVKVTGINYEMKEEGLLLSVSGVANARKDLLDFANNLRKKQEVASVTVPVSNFAKESQIPFSFEVAIKSNEK